MKLPRALSRTTLATVLLASAGAAGCDWRVYDDLKDDLWVDVQERPSGVETGFFGDQVLPLALGADDAGVRFAVVARSKEQIYEASYDAAGVQGVPLVGDKQTIDESFSKNGIDFDFVPRQPVATEPGGDRIAVALVTRETNDAGVALDNFKIIEVQRSSDANGNSFLGKVKVYEPASNVTPALVGAEPVQSITYAGASHLVVARSNRVMLADRDGAANMELTGCTLPANEGAFAVAYADVGAFIDPLTSAEYPDVVAGGDIIVAIAPINADFEPTGPGRLAVIVGGFSQDTTAAPCLFADGADLPGFDLAMGSEVLPRDLGDGQGLKLVVSYPGTDGRISVARYVDGIGAIEQSEPFPNLNDIEVGDLDGDGLAEVVVGLPNTDVGGATNAGQVDVIDAADLTSSILSFQTSDPQPQDHFGTSVTIAPFGTASASQNILIVGAVGSEGGKVYTYFRTSLYDDVRVGE